MRAPTLPPPSTDPDSIVLTFVVAPEQAGLRLDRFIQSRIPRLSRTRAQSIVRACAYRADGRRRAASDRVRRGETVLLVRPRFVEPDVPLHFEVLHEDDTLLSIDKPAGLPVHPTATYHRHTLTFLLRERYGDPAPVIAHRLDRETSGIVLCAKGTASERALKTAFERREIHKTYLAIVRGEMRDTEGVIDLPMGPAREGLHVLMELRQRGAADALAARTRYLVRERRSGRTLVELEPETGRQHQLRVHLAALGHPVVGDKLYGPEGHQPFLEYIETGMTAALRERLGHTRHALHAHAIRFVHPATRQAFEVRSELPPDLKGLWE